MVEKNNRTLHETFLSADRSCEEFENNSDPFGDWSGEATGPEGSGVSMSLSDVIYQGICLIFIDYVYLAFMRNASGRGWKH